MMPWLFIVGIGEDGWDGLSPAAQAAVRAAERLFGGDRNLAMLPESLRGERHGWNGVDALVERLRKARGRRCCVLASGEPLWFGIGGVLAARFPVAEMAILPHRGAFSLASARLGWPLQDVACLSVHSRPLDALSLHFAPGARLLALARDGDSANEVAALLCEHGWGASAMAVLERLGGPAERRIDATARSWGGRTADLAVIAVACQADRGTRPLSRLAGLPDDAFSHDGQITKREVRAVTLASLAPLPGELLWDIGCGCGSIAIEWMRVGGRAVALDTSAAHCAFTAANAAMLGVPDLMVVQGRAPQSLEALGGTPPDAVFIGGGLSHPEVLPRCWQALRPGGRLAANAVTAEGEAALLAWHASHGGELLRLSVTRLGETGGFRGWKPLVPVTHYIGRKP